MDWGLLLWMIGAHYIADFDLQTRFVAENKGKYWYIMMAHVISWTTIVCIPLFFYGVLDWVAFAILIPIHWASDWYKAQALEHPRYNEKPLTLLYIDQSIHIIQLVTVWTWTQL